MPLALVEIAIAALGLLDEACLYAMKSSGVLANPVRRRVVSTLADGETTRRERLAALLAADESVPQTDCERLEIALHHAHLPKLEEESLIEYDQRTGDVVLWVDPDTARELVDSA